MAAFTFTVKVETARESGKFMSNDEQREQIQEALQDADPGEVDGGPDGDSVYTIESWEVASA
jgi:DNA invertase Pin-like site-specific DNA recombinase